VTGEWSRPAAASEGSSGPSPFSRPRPEYFCDYAWLGGGTVASGVTLRVSGATIEAVGVNGSRPDHARHLAGLTLPGLANAHSHAFHRALRGRAQRGRESFWTWREMMYSVADGLTPEQYFALARAVYAEMALTGFTVVGEFHYLHHAPGGVRYDDPNAMGRAVLAAGREAGVKVVLLDTCYIEAGPGRALEGPQLRFGDGDVEAWAARADEMAGVAIVEGSGAVGAAIHSVRAVPPGAARRVAEWAAARSAPLHFHCSEQPAENEAALAVYGATPVQLLAQAGALRRGSVAVHATHVGEADAKVLGSSGTTVCMCPTTERDLGDGIGPARRLLGLGSPLALGSDSQAVVDPFEEMRALELDERLASQQRGNFSTAQLLEAATAAGYTALGDLDGGRLRPGAPADFVTLSLDGPTWAGIDEGSILEGAVFAAGPRDVTDVVVAGRPVVQGGHHLLVGDVAGALRSAINALEWP
jgi:formiminoglutamate deiminase